MSLKIAFRYFSVDYSLVTHYCFIKATYQSMSKLLCLKSSYYHFTLTTVGGPLPSAARA